MRRPLFLICLLLVAVTVLRGFLSGNAAVPEEACLTEGRLLTITGQIDQKDSEYFYISSIQIYDQRAAASQQTIPDNITITNENESLRLPKARLQWKRGEGETLLLPIGTLVTLEGTLRFFSDAANPGEFDSRSYYESIGIWGRVEKAVLVESRGPGWREGGLWYGGKERLYQIKQYFLARLYRIFPEKEASVMSTMLLGERTALDEQLKELYQKNGIIHILSISGLHITIIGMGVYRLLRRTGAPAWLAAVLGGSLLTAYGILTGMGISACRAIGMYLIRMLGNILGRTYDMLTALGVMAVVLSWGNPAVLGHAGYLLSFGSLLGIGVVYPVWWKGIRTVWEHRTVENREAVREKEMVSGKGLAWLQIRAGRREAARKEAAWKKPARKEPAVWKESHARKEPAVWKEAAARMKAAAGRRLAAGAAGSMVAGASITLTTLPIQLWFYYEVPVYSMVLNLLVLPFMGLAVTCGMLALLVPGLGALGTVDCVILQGYELLCQSFERLPFHLWNPGKPQLWQVLFYYGVLAAGSMWMNRTGRQDRNRTGDGGKGSVRQRIFIPVFMLCSGILLLQLRPAQKNQVTFLDVGQGDGICMQTAGGSVFLFDGGSSSRSRVGKYVLLPYLKYHGIRRVDALLISHPDTDHYNGAAELLRMGRREGIIIKQLILPDVAQKQDEAWKELLAAAWEYYGESVGDGAGKSLGIGAGSGRGDGAGKSLGIGAGSGRGDGAGKSLEIGAGSGQEAVAEDLAERRRLAMQEAGKLIYIQEGQCVQSREVTMTCLHPPAGYANEDSNAGSQCFYIEFTGCESGLLLTGDIHGNAEQLLLEALKERGIGNIAVLKTAHHGSRNSTPDTLLEQLKPSLAVISCGSGNRYGHPHAELLERLEKAEIPYLQTPDTGALTILFHREELRVRAFSLEVPMLSQLIE